ncbi:MAG: plasmid stabilization protein [Phenylobacterium zucineum]|nr:MAG: plasmid stabilization protein [Phenylobacterium zucineum]
MADVVFAPEAEEQLMGLYRYIAAAASPETARRFTSAVVDQCEALSAYPARGAPRDDLRPGLRTLAFRGRITIAYAIEPREVVILGVFYGGRDLASALGND